MEKIRTKTHGVLLSLIQQHRQYQNALQQSKFPTEDSSSNLLTELSKAEDEYIEALDKAIELNMAALIFYLREGANDHAVLVDTNFLTIDSVLCLKPQTQKLAEHLQQKSTEAHLQEFVDTAAVLLMKSDIDIQYEFTGYLLFLKLMHKAK